MFNANGDSLPGPLIIAPVAQKLVKAIHRINRYPEDEYYENQLRYPLARDLSGG